MKNAEKTACSLLYAPKNPIYDENIRKYQGCPTIAVTERGRIFAGWYSGGTREPHMENYNLVVTSEDGGKTWSKPVLVIPSDKKLCIHALDIQLWIDKENALHVVWVQNNTIPVPEHIPKAEKDQPQVIVDGYLFNDFAHSEWESVCYNPDDEDLVFSQPKRLDSGFLRCKPTLLENGDVLSFNYDQISSRYGYSISTDNGKTYKRYYGAEKLATMFDECMAYQLKDGSIRMLSRNYSGKLAECYSYDNGRTWTEAKYSDIVCADTRFFVSRTPSGRILLVTNDDSRIRKNITVSLSEDDGKTWKYKHLIDERTDTSYPDADFYGDKIYLVFDRERTGAKEILFAEFSEKDIIEKNKIEVKILSKP